MGISVQAREERPSWGSSLGPDRGDHGEFHWNATAGDHTLRLEIDPEDVVDETNEENNRYVDQYSVAAAPKPDLVPDLHVQKPGHWYVQDEAIQVGLDAESIGEAEDEIEGFVLRLSLDGDILREQRFEYIYDAEFDLDPMLLVAGEHTFTATVDAADEVEESDESNNVAERTFTVLEQPPPPELSVSATGTDEEVFEGAQFRVHGTIKNGGQSADQVSAEVRIDGEPHGSIQIGAVDALSSASFDLDLEDGLGAGEHELMIVADPDDAIAEDAESNNVERRERWPHPGRSAEAM